MFEEKPRNGSTDIQAYVKYGAVFTFGGNQYLAKITSKKYPNSNAQNFYSIESVSVAKLPHLEYKNSAGQLDAVADGERQSPIAEFVDTVAKLADDCKDVSKVVDKNGEPLVMYHGDRVGSVDYTVFEDQLNQRNTQANGFYFTQDRKYAEGFGGQVREFFLNVRNPYYGKRSEASDKLLESIFNMDSSEILQYNPKMRQEIIQAAEEASKEYVDEIDAGMEDGSIEADDVNREQYDLAKAIINGNWESDYVLNSLGQGLFPDAVDEAISRVVEEYRITKESPNGFTTALRANGDDG